MCHGEVDVHTGGPGTTLNLNLAEMKDVEKMRFLDGPISQEGLWEDLHGEEND